MLSLLANRTRFETYYKQTDLNSLLNFLDLTTRARISQPGMKKPLLVYGTSTNLFACT
jgi:hypothetical protein